MNVTVDQDTCIGCGLCTGLAETVFRLNDGGKAEAFHQPDAGEEAAVRDAIDSCPVNAISGE